MKISRLGKIALILALSLSQFSCSDSSRPARLETISVGLLPDHKPERMKKRYTPLWDHIQSETGIKYKLKIPASYQELLQWFSSGEVDIAYFGGVTYLKANQQSGAIPLVLRDVDNNFQSVIMVNRKHPADAVRKLKGARFAFGSRLSTSGHYMPRYFMQRLGVVPEEYFSSTLYSGTHDRTVEWVRDGKVDAGVANLEIVQKMFGDGRLKKNEVRLLWETPPYTDYVWAIQPGISEIDRTKLRDAFMKLGTADLAHKKILDGLGAAYFLPARHEQFERLQKIMTQLEFGTK